MSCISLHKGQDASCKSWTGKYYQQIVLINKDDVLDHNILSQANFVDDGQGNSVFYNYRHRIQFELKEGKTGFRFRGNNNGISYLATFSKTIEENIPQYDHKLQLPIFGATEDSKFILKTLDIANYFAAIQLMNGVVEIYGFENGLITSDYDFSIQENLGGTAIPLQSKDLEDEPPFVYYSSNPLADFDNLFSDVELVELGDFNNDFSDDFFIG